MIGIVTGLQIKVSTYRSDVLIFRFGTHMVMEMVNGKGVTAVPTFLLPFLIPKNVNHSSGNQILLMLKMLQPTIACFGTEKSNNLDSLTVKGKHLSMNDRIPIIRIF